MTASKGSFSKTSLIAEDIGKLNERFLKENKNYILVDGLTIRRRRVNYKHIEPIADTIEIKKGASHENVETAIKKAKLEKKMKETVSIPTR